MEYFQICFRKAAEQSNPVAQLLLGNCYFEGEGVEKNYTEAVKWWTKAAEQGNVKAQLLLSMFVIFCIFLQTDPKNLLGLA